MPNEEKYYAKLAKRNIGPFEVLKPINEMAYNPRLPKAWLNYNTLDLSQLKPSRGDLPKEPITKEPSFFKGQEEKL